MLIYETIVLQNDWNNWLFRDFCWTLYTKKMNNLNSLSDLLLDCAIIDACGPDIVSCPASASTVVLWIQHRQELNLPNSRYFSRNLYPKQWCTGFGSTVRLDVFQTQILRWKLGSSSSTLLKFCIFCGIYLGVTVCNTKFIISTYIVHTKLRQNGMLEKNEYTS